MIKWKNDPAYYWPMFINRHYSPLNERVAETPRRRRGSFDKPPKPSLQVKSCRAHSEDCGGPFCFLLCVFLLLFTSGCDSDNTSGKYPAPPPIPDLPPLGYIILCEPEGRFYTFAYPDGGLSRTRQIKRSGAIKKAWRYYEWDKANPRRHEPPEPKYNWKPCGP